jgi:hypothetical protein
METTEIINLWKSYDRKLEEALALNKKVAEEVTRLKAKSLLSSMRPMKIFTLMAGIIWVAFGGLVVINLFIHAYSQVSRFFLFSASIQLLLTALAIVIYIYQLVMIEQVSITEPVVTTQKTLSSLKSSTLLVTRVLFLQLPVWTTFYLSENMLKGGNVMYLLINGLITLFFTYASLWLFFNIKYENKDKKWFKLLFDGPEWTPILKSIELYRDIESFSAEKINRE